MPQPTPTTGKRANRTPGTDASAAVRLVTVGAVALLLYNNLVGGFINPAFYVPLNLALTAAIVVAARRFGMRAEEIGTTAEAASSGLRWGLAVTAVAAVGLGIAVAIPATRILLDDARAADIGIGLLLYRTLIRIPLGTVLLEEVAFRGVLLAAWTRWAGVRSAVLGSSAVFGLWHVRPTLGVLDANELGAGVLSQVGAVSAAVLITAVGGIFFCWLRLRSRSLLAPILAHIGFNSLALTAAFVVMENGWA